MRGCIWFEVSRKHCTSRFLTPWLHYIPVRSMAEMQQIILYFEAHPAERLSFARRAQRFYADHYAAEKIWWTLGRHLALNSRILPVGQR